jgi:hypothetical protein
MAATSNGTRTAIEIAPTANNFTSRSIRTVPRGPIRSSGGSRTICGR